VGRHDNRWIYTGLVAYLTGLPQGGTVEARPRRAGQGDRGRPKVITYGSTRIPYVRDRVCLLCHERQGLFYRRLSDVWPSCRCENVGRGDSLSKARAVGEYVSGASLRQ
jgi:hypothetical protein